MNAANEAVDGDGVCTEPDAALVTSALGGVHRKAGWGAGGLIVDSDFLLLDDLSDASSGKDVFPLSVFLMRFAQRSPQALQSVLGPVGPLRHSGESVRPQV